MNYLCLFSFFFLFHNFSHLHLVDDVQEEFVGILLPVGGELGVPPADQSLEHAWRDALLLVLETREPGGHTQTGCTRRLVSGQVTSTAPNYQLTCEYCLAVGLM